MSEAKRLNESDLSELLSGKDEFELMDLLATEVGVAGSESQEERNSSVVFRRSVLRAAIKQLRAR